jgi:hypothetical protein
LYKEEILGIDKKSYKGQTHIYLAKSKEYFKVAVKFHADLEDAIQSRAAEFGLPPGGYIKSLVMKDLEEANNN